MPLTNYPFGVSSFGIPVIGAGNILTTGNVFFVSSTSPLKSDTPTAGRDLATPFATIDYAIGQCTANNGDYIIVEPLHVETVSAAAGVALDVAGVTIVGVGQGSNRPTVNFTTSTAASFRVTAANCAVRNVLFVGAIDALASPIQIQAADFVLDQCETRDTAGSAQATVWILTTAAANRLRITNHVHDGDTAAGTGAWLAIVGGDGIVVDGLRCDGNFSVGGIDIRTTATTDLEVRNVMFRTRNAADIFLVDTITGSTGMIGPSLYLRLQDNAANITEAITGATFVLFGDILVVNAAGEQAMAINTTASTDA
jgi:hypothetical protein